MPKRISTPKTLDTVQNARRVVDESIRLAEEGQTPQLFKQVMAEMGRRGGQIGGKRRLETLSQHRRSQIAKQAAKARWAKAKK